MSEESKKEQTDLDEALKRLQESADVVQTVIVQAGTKGAVVALNSVAKIMTGLASALSTTVTVKNDEDKKEKSE